MMKCSHERASSRVRVFLQRKVGIGFDHSFFFSAGACTTAPVVCLAWVIHRQTFVLSDSAEEAYWVNIDLKHCKRQTKTKTQKRRN